MENFKEYAKCESDKIIAQLKNNDYYLKIAFIPDLHYKYIDEMRVSVSNIIHSINYISKTNKIDCVVLGGDNVGNYPEGKIEHINMMDELKDLFNNLDVPWFAVMGNHDDNSIHCVKDTPGFDATLIHGNEISNKEQYIHFFNNQIKYGYVQGDKLYSMYGYYDTKCTRLLFLNPFDLPDIVINNELVYGRQWIGAYSNEQLSWLIDVGLPDNLDKDVIIFQHTPLSLSFEAGNDIKIYNNSALTKILNTFQNSGVIIDSGSDGKFLSYGINHEYKRKHNILAFISGHIHKDRHGYVDNILNITTNCACRDPKGLGCDENNNPLKKFPYSRLETCFDLYCFSKNDISIFRYGIGEDRIIHLHQ